MITFSHDMRFYLHKMHRSLSLYLLCLVDLKIESILIIPHMREGKPKLVDTILIKYTHKQSCIYILTFDINYLAMHKVQIYAGAIIQAITNSLKLVHYLPYRRAHPAITSAYMNHTGL